MKIERALQVLKNAVTVFQKVAVVVVTIGIIVALVWFFVLPHDLMSSLKITQSAITTMIRETMVNLVTHKVTTQVYCTAKDVPSGKVSGLGDFLLGKNEAIFIAKVSFYYGMSLEEMKDSDVVIDSESITITLPEPQVIARDTPMAEYEMFSYAPATRILVDKLLGTNIEKELRTVFDMKAMEFAKSNGMMPDKQEMIKIIQPLVDRLIAGSTNKKIVLQ